MAKMMLKSSQGRVRDRGVTWFLDLVDKNKCMPTTECSSVLTCTYGVLLAFDREEYQDPLVLGHEELRMLGRAPTQSG